ncbi:MAG: bifunctional diguanylate cyclase/phosphodiesterase [Acidobacteria bacterium]|nr:bifunctional diguanylate cyclase/phosphodiesterase [Acidobacteriota bacterium]
MARPRKTEPDLLLAISPDGGVDVLSGKPRALTPRVFRQLVTHAESTLASGRQSRFRFTRGRGPGARQFEATLMPVQSPPALAVIREVTSEQNARAGAARIRRNLIRLSHSLSLSSRRLVEHDDFELALREITASSATALSVLQASIWILSEDWSRMECREHFHSGTQTHSNGAVLWADQFPAYFEALRSERTIAAVDACTDSRTAEFRDAYLAPNNIGAMLDSPIRRMGRLRGVVCFEHAGEPRGWTTEEEVFAASVADMIALILEEEDRRHVLKRLEREVNEDSLTGLANRRAMLQWIEECATRAFGKDDGPSLMIVEIDRLEAVNEALGHAAGDKLLHQCARSLADGIRGADRLARIGGDQFAILLGAPAEHDAALAMARRIQELLHQPMEIDGRVIKVQASIGIAFAADGPEASKDLYRCASLATSRAKQRGGGRVEIFKPSMHDSALQRLNLEAEMRQGLDRGEFEPFLQPILSLSDGAIHSFEALLRWRHPCGRIISPGEFLNEAEETGLSIPIGWSTLRQVCSWIKTMQSTTGAPVHVSFNLSQKQFQSPDLLDRLASIVHHAQVDPGLIQIEVTETVVSTYAETALRLAALKTHGFALAVDDFGTGYSSLSLLHTFALDVLKIDRSFIARMDSGGLEIVRTIVALARALGMKVVAEGIETVQQARQVAELGCEYGQGYWLGKPMDIHAAASLLIHRGSQPVSLKRQEKQAAELRELIPVN